MATGRWGQVGLGPTCSHKKKIKMKKGKKIYKMNYIYIYIYIYIIHFIYFFSFFHFNFFLVRAGGAEPHLPPTTSCH